MTWKFQKSATPNDAVNLAPATGSEAEFNHKGTLKQQGWTIPSSSDATTYNSSGDQITSASSGANGMANTNAWWRTRDPGGTREIVSQRGSSDLLFRRKVSPSARFTGGSPSASQVPSATDERVYAGGGTDAAPTFQSFYAANASYKQHCGADDASPYDFYNLCVTNGTAAGQRRHWMVDMLAGSYSADAQPWIIDANTGVFNQFAAYGVGTQGFGQGIYKSGLSGETFVNWAGLNYGEGVGSIPGNLPPNQGDGKSLVIPIPVARLNSVANPGWKGFAPVSMIGYCGMAYLAGVTDTVGGVTYAYWNSWVALVWPTGIAVSL
jgi:hypothetical protein